MARLVNASDRAILVVFDEAMTPEAGRKVRVLASWLRDEPPEAVVDLNPAYSSLLVRYDPLGCDPEALGCDLMRRAGALDDRGELQPRSFEIPVRYGGEFGPDLAPIARAIGITAKAFVAAHSGASYEVRFIGFSPGFPYLSGLPELLHTPRKTAPRERVPAGSVAIAGSQAGIYPVPSPAGWNVIGQTDFVLFELENERGPTLVAGDRVHFRPVVDRP